MGSILIYNNRDVLHRLGTEPFRHICRVFLVIYLIWLRMVQFLPIVVVVAF
jgi:hypothetical protein